MSDRVPFRPSNSTEGSIFEARWCERCDRFGDDERGYCEIQGRAFGGETPEEWTSDPSGENPACSAFVPEVPARVWEACAERCAEFGDPPCRRAEHGCRPCRECLEQCGVVIYEPLDPAAVVRPLL